MVSSNIEEAPPSSDDVVPPNPPAEEPKEHLASGTASHPPNGGWEAWLQVFASWLLVFNTWGTMITFGDYQTFYESGTLFKASSSNISWIGSIQSLLVFAMGPIVGPIYDRGHVRLLLTTGTLGIVFGHMMLSLCKEYWQALLAQGFVVGISGGFLFVPSLAIVQSYFSTHLGLAVGFVATGSSVGGIIYPVIFTNLIHRVGFAWTARTIGFVALPTLLIPVVFSKQRIRPQIAREMMDMSAFKDGKFMLCILACFLGYSGNYLAFFYTSFFGAANGWMNNSLALYLVPILNGASAIGRVLPNWLADSIGIVNVVIPGSLAIGIVLLCNIAVHNAGGVIATTIIFGFLSGIFIALPPLMFMLLTKDKAKLGARMGMAYAMVGLSVLPGGPGSGAVLQHDNSHFDWKAAWIFAGVLQISACLVFCVLRIWQGGFSLKVKV